jgi:hypothetical protein
MNSHLFVDVVLPLVTYLLGVVCGSFAQKRVYELAERGEFKRDAVGKRDTKEQREDFAPPVWSGMPLHEFSAFPFDAQNPHCCQCGAGRYHAVHAFPSVTNRELWDRIQKGKPS